jgi:hypothetical protein
LTPIKKRNSAPLASAYPQANHRGSAEHHRPSDNSNTSAHDHNSSNDVTNYDVFNHFHNLLAFMPENYSGSLSQKMIQVKPSQIGDFNLLFS